MLIDQIGSVVPSKNDNLFLQLTEIAAESVLTQSLSSFATYPFKMPNWRQLASDIATDAVKNTVYNIGRQKTDYGRIANNAVWGFAAGATAEWVQSKMQGRESHMVQKGLSTMVAKVVYGEVCKFVLNPRS